MAGANMNGINAVFGEWALTKIKSCEFHYKQSVNRVESKLREESNTGSFVIAFSTPPSKMLIYEPKKN